MKSTKKNEFYKTTDLNLAAILKTLGYENQWMEKDYSNGRVSFFFKKDPRIDETIAKYFAGKLRIDPLEFTNAVKNLKTAIYNKE